MNGLWFFSTREGIALGPYLTHQEADQEARLLSNQLEPMCPGRQSRAVVCQYIYNARNNGQPLSPQFAATTVR